MLLIVSFVFVLFGVQYNGGFLPDILLLTQAPICVGFDGTIIVYYYYHTLLTMYYSVVMFGGSAWRLPCSGYVFTAYATVVYYYYHV